MKRVQIIGFLVGSWVESSEKWILRIMWFKSKFCIKIVGGIRSFFVFETIFFCTPDQP
jgi:hypothetical protein